MTGWLVALTPWWCLVYFLPHLSHSMCVLVDGSWIRLPFLPSVLPPLFIHVCTVHHTLPSLSLSFSLLVLIVSLSTFSSSFLLSSITIHLVFLPHSLIHHQPTPSIFPPSHHQHQLFFPPSLPPSHPQEAVLPFAFVSLSASLTCYSLPPLPSPFLSIPSHTCLLPSLLLLFFPPTISFLFSLIPLLLTHSLPPSLSHRSSFHSITVTTTDQDAYKPQRRDTRSRVHCWRDE